MADRDTQAVLGQLLRVHYSELVEEPVPPRLLKLWSALGERETKSDDAD